jgi:cell division protein FtsX
MIFLIALMMLVTVNTASAQMWANQPKTVTYFDNKTKEKIATAIISQNMIVLRDKHDTHYATIMLRPNGVREWFDPHGNPIDPKTTKLPLD